MPNRLQSVGPPTGAATSSKKRLKSQCIEELASRKIRSFRGTIDEYGEYLDVVYQSNRSLAASIASDYRDRFLIELIQNAYDAQPVGTHDGKIEITLDKRLGESGALFIANSGHPFTEENVKGLCDIGLSQKPLGESIGNKGLGFRSVVQITDVPQIYSQCPAAPGENQFSGFCFRFAGPQDYPDLIDDPQHIKLAIRDLPIFHIPICLDSQSAAVCAYAEASFSTVIELPLRDTDSRDSVQREIDHLCEQKVPILLFLDRVSSLIVRTIDKTGQIETKFVFTRSEENCVATDMKLSRVDLGDAGLFLIASHSVAEATMKDAIATGISRKELNEHWERWTGDGEVAVAVRLDSIVPSSRLYTFLPMGEQAAAPFPGYLHGSFSPSSNRKNLNAGIRLNALLLSEATILTARAIHHIIADPIGRMAVWLTVEERATAVVDLVCWAEVDSLETDEELAADLVQKLADCFDVSSFDDAPVVPCLLPRSDNARLTWQPPKSVRRWPAGTKMFAASVAAQFARNINVWPIWETLGPRIDALEKFLHMYSDDYAGEPRAEERAHLVSLVAKNLGKSRRTPKNKWFKFFREIPDFMGRDGKYLAELPVLLGDDGQLHMAMSPEQPIDDADQPARRRRRRIVTAVFSPPDPRRASTDEDLEVDPPKKLSKRFAFLLTAFPWHGQLSAARTYFEEHRLVEKFDREAVLAHLSRTLQGESNKEVLKGGLRWAFQLWRQPRNHGRPFRLQSQHRFRVPTLNGGYVEASESVFSEGWPAKTAGELLQKFLDAAPAGLSDLERMASCRLAAPDHPVFRGKFIDDWVFFLTELGVNEGLTPESKKCRNKYYSADRFSDFSFLEDYDIPIRFASFWSNDISAQDPTLLHLPSDTDYVIDGELTWLPGQADIDRFSGACKVLYAKLIFEWLSKDLHVLWDINVHHRFHHLADRRSWPTPLKSFLRSACWLPVDEPVRSSSEQIEVRLCDVWVNKTGGKRFESYLRRPSHILLRYLEQAPDRLIDRLVAHGDLRIYDDPLVLPEQLEFLAQQYANKGFDHYYERRLLNLYNRTWQLLANHLDDDVGDKFDAKRAPAKILVRREQALELVPILGQNSEHGDQVYVCDTSRESDINLLEASGRPFFVLREADAQKIGVLFETFYGQRIRRLSQVTYELLADGKNIQDSVATPALEICPQLRAMLAIAMEALKDTEAQRLPSDRTTILAKLERLTMIKAGKLRFVIDGLNVSTYQDTVSAFHFRFDDGQAVIVVQSFGEWTWELVDRSIPAVCEALGHWALAPHLRLLVEHLRHREPLQEAESRPFKDVERFSSILQLSSSASLAARASLSAGVEHHTPWIRVVLHILIGPAAVEVFDVVRDDVFKDAGLFHDILSQLLGDSPVSANELLAICRTALGAKDFREGLGLDFGDFNASLVALGLEPETYPELHRLQLKNFIREKEVDIIDCLRTSCVVQLNKMQPVEGYATKRDNLRTLSPDPAWLSVFEEPPQGILVEHVNAWLAENNAPPIGDCDGGLEPLAQVRSHNQQFVHNFAQRAILLVRAWCAKFQSDNLMASLAAEGGAEGLRKRLDDIGVLDFCILDDIAMMRWLQTLEIWPTGMNLSLDLKVLGLSEEDLTAESMKEHEASEARRREARSIFFNGQIVDPNDVDFLTLSEELHSGLTSRVLGMALGSTSDLADARRSAFSPRASGDVRSGKGRRPRVPVEKTELIGRLGEFVVYHWLRKILPKQDIDAAWQSENRLPLTGRQGDDSLGFDFEVSYRNQLWQIEVKASLEDSQSFEMGATEVRAARIAARTRSGVQYKIAYVSNISDSSKTTIEMLPNPMTEEGERVLQLGGEGIRYSFSRL